MPQLAISSASAAASASETPKKVTRRAGRAAWKCRAATSRNPFRSRESSAVSSAMPGARWISADGPSKRGSHSPCPPSSRSPRPP
jgi:hypothetical protein